MADSDSSLSSPPTTDDEMPVAVAPSKTTAASSQKKKAKKNNTILSFFKNKSPSPVRKKRPASPPHESAFEDNPDIAFIVMFRSRFTDAFSSKTPHFGPQDIERGVAEGLPSSQIETFLCAILGLVLNRKKPIEKGHYGRALEEAISTQKSQWPREWGGTNPISGGRSFNTMLPNERLTLLKTLILWGLSTSDVVNNMIKEGYKSRTSKEKNDTNIVLSVQPWGRDGDNRRYWLIEGQDDTSFRVYRENNPKLKTITWWSVAGSIDEIRALAQKLKDDDGTRDAKQLSDKMLNAIPRFEATEEKRKRREYRQARKARFEPGFSLYEGRTRGKRMRYTFSDDEEETSEAGSMRRSSRQAGREMSAAPQAPTVTASGRQVRSRAAGLYGESLLSGQTTEGASPATGDYVRSDGSEEPQLSHNRATRSNGSGDTNGWHKGRKHIETYNSVDEMDDEDDATSWDGGDEEEDEADPMEIGDDDDDVIDEASEEDELKTLVVQLKYRKGSLDAADKATKTDGQSATQSDQRGNDAAPARQPAPDSAVSTDPAATYEQSINSQQQQLMPKDHEKPGVAGKDSISLGSYKLSSPQPAFSAPTPPYASPKDGAPKPIDPLRSPFQKQPLPSTTPTAAWN